MVDSVWFNVTNVLIAGILIIYLPIAGLIESNKRKNVINVNKVKDYYSQSLWSFLPVAIITVPLILGFITFDKLGFRLISIQSSKIPKVFIVIVISFFLLHVLYNIYSILMLKFNKNARDQTAKSIDKNIYNFLPITKEEQKAWKIVALSAGLTEEIVYRGYIFFIVSYYVQDISVYIIVLISSVIFGIGHVYQGKDVIKPLIIGFLYGLYYVVLQSIVPVILIHILQDLIVAYIFDEDNSKKSST